MIRLSNSKQQPERENNNNNNNNNILSIIQTNHNEYNINDGDKTIKPNDIKNLHNDSSDTLNSFDKNDDMSKVFENDTDKFQSPTDDSTLKADVKPVIDTTLNNDSKMNSSGMHLIDLKELIQKNTFQKPKVNMILIKNLFLYIFIIIVIIVTIINNLFLI